MTWNELVEKINKLTEEQRNTDVTIFIEEKDENYLFADEFYPVDRFDTNKGEKFDQLDEDHPFLVISEQ